MFNDEEFFEGKRLVYSSTHTISEDSEGCLRENIQDESVECYYKGMLIADLGIENYMYYDKYITVKQINYISNRLKEGIIRHKGKGIVPVVVLVLNFTNQRWISNKNLHNLVKKEPRQRLKKLCKDSIVHNKSLEKVFAELEELVQYMPNVESKVIDVAYIPDDVRKRFKSDFKVIADFLVERRKGIYDPSNHNEILKHPLDVLRFLKEYTNDTRYQEIEKSVISRMKKGEVIRMCTFVDEFWKKGEESGIKIGEKIGEKRGERRGERIGKRRGERIGTRKGLIALVNTLKMFLDTPEEILSKVIENEGYENVVLEDIMEYY